MKWTELRSGMTADGSGAASSPGGNERGRRGRFSILVVATLIGCGPRGLPPVDATRPSEDPRILDAPSTMSNGSPLPMHQTETVVTDLELMSDGAIGGMSVDADGNLYSTNFRESVWRITPGGAVTLLNGEFTSASGNLPLENGDLLQSDWTENRIYRIQPDGTRSVFAEAGLDGPVGLVRRPDGDFIVANHRGEYLARVGAAGGDAEVVLRHPDMTAPNGVTIDDEGNIYVSDLDTGKVIQWRPDGGVAILAELPGDGNAHGVIAGGALYVNKIWDHVIYRVELGTGAYGIVTGNGRAGYDDGPTGVATIEEPNGIATTAAKDVVYFNTHRGTMGNGFEGRVIVRKLLLPR